MSAPTTDAVPRRPRADAQRNAERLLEAASEVFAEQGPGASLEEIARRAGVGIGTLYRHFPTRQELQGAVFTNAVESARARADGLLTAEDPRAAFATWLRDQLDQAGFCRTLGAEVMISSLDDEPDAPSPCEAMRTAGAALLAVRSSPEACAPTRTSTTCSGSSARSRSRPTTHPTRRADRADVHARDGRHPGLSCRVAGRAGRRSVTWPGADELRRGVERRSGPFATVPADLGGTRGARAADESAGCRTDPR